MSQKTQTLKTQSYWNKKKKRFTLSSIRITQCSYERDICLLWFVAVVSGGYKTDFNFNDIMVTLSFYFDSSIKKESQISRLHQICIPYKFTQSRCILLNQVWDFSLLMFVNNLCHVRRLSWQLKPLINGTGTVAHNCHGKRINLMAKREFQGKKKPRGKKKNLAAKRRPRQKERLTAKFLQCKEDILILIALSLFPFALRFFFLPLSFYLYAVRFFFLRWGYSFATSLFSAEYTFGMVWGLTALKHNGKKAL